MKSDFTKGFLSGVGSLAILVIGGVALSGFQGAAPKVGMVNLEEAMTKSDLFAANREAMTNVLAARRATWVFLDANRVMKEADAARFKDLTSKLTLSAQEKAELEKIKSSTLDAQKRFDELKVKPSPTPDEIAALTELRNRFSKTGELLDAWQKEFQREIEGTQLRQNDDLVQKATEAAKTVGKRGGFSVVYTSASAIYAPNDLTSEVIKAMNSK
jgi:Skp family chaperone for outer membrane proteins